MAKFLHAVFFIYFNLIWTVLILGFVFIYNIMFVYMYTFICPLLFKANWIEFLGFLEIRQLSPFLHNLLNYELWLLLSLLRAMSLHWPPPSLSLSLSLSLFSVFLVYFIRASPTPYFLPPSCFSLFLFIVCSSHWLDIDTFSLSVFFESRIQQEDAFSTLLFLFCGWICIYLDDFLFFLLLLSDL